MLLRAITPPARHCEPATVGVAIHPYITLCISGSPQSLLLLRNDGKGFCHCELVQQAQAWQSINKKP